jgi:hypothetical protein
VSLGFEYSMHPSQGKTLSTLFDNQNYHKVPVSYFVQAKSETDTVISTSA